jgi:hypothetical protein
VKKLENSLRVHSVCFGGSDPLHLTSHIIEPQLYNNDSEIQLLIDTSNGPHAVLLSQNIFNWYRFLSEAPELQTDHWSGRSWQVEVIIKSIGSIGTYRRSRKTNRWFSGRHRFHVKGN